MDLSAPSRGVKLEGTRPEREGHPLLSEKHRNRSSALHDFQAELGKGAFFKMRLSMAYLIYCAVMAVAALSLAIYLVIEFHVYKAPLSVWTVALDGVMTLAIVGETIVDMSLLRSGFWTSAWHIFDMAVAVICSFSWILMLLEHIHVLAAFDEFVTIFLLTVRYMAQLIRIARYVRTCSEARETRTMVDEEGICFDNPVNVNL